MNYVWTISLSVGFMNVTKFNAADGKKSVRPAKHIISFMFAIQ